jgi:hypothetical protein
MPGATDGLTVISAMRDLNPNAIAILLTGFPEMDVAAQAMLRQADADFTELVELIKRTIGSIRLLEPGENRQTATLLVPIHRIHPPKEPMNSVSRIAACYEHTVPATVRYGSYVTNGQIVVGCGWLIVGNVKNLFGMVATQIVSVIRLAIFPPGTPQRLSRGITTEHCLTASMPQPSSDCAIVAG